MELEESIFLTSDYTTKIQSSRQYGTGTKTEIKSKFENIPSIYENKFNPTKKMYKILKIPFFTSHTNRDENHLVGECVSK